MPFGDLPFEVLEVIVAAAAGEPDRPQVDRETLKDLSLVNASFREICQARLWSGLSLEAYEENDLLRYSTRTRYFCVACQNLSDCVGPKYSHNAASPLLLQASKHLLGHVKTLVLHLYGSPKSSQDRDYIRILQECRDLKALTVHWVSGVPREDDLVELQKALANRSLSKIWLRPATRETMAILDDLKQDPHELGIYLPFVAVGIPVAADQLPVERKFRPARVSIGLTKRRARVSRTDILQRIHPPSCLAICASKLPSAICTGIGDWAGPFVEELTIGNIEVPLPDWPISSDLSEECRDIMPFFTAVRNLHLSTPSDRTQGLPDSIEHLHIHKWPAGSEAPPFMEVLHAHAQARTAERHLKIVIDKSVLDDTYEQPLFRWNSEDSLLAQEVDGGLDGRCATSGDLRWYLDGLCRQLGARKEMGFRATGVRGQLG